MSEVTVREAVDNKVWFELNENRNRSIVSAADSLLIDSRCLLLVDTNLIATYLVSFWRLGFLK